MATEKSIILFSQLSTPLGQMFICATENGVCLVEFDNNKRREKELIDLQKMLNAHTLAGENDHIKQAKKEIAEYFDGQRKIFEVPLHMPGTDFQVSVWESVCQIPYGTTSTYQQQAKRIKNPKAIRAMGAANGSNRISIIVPCHRVIGKDGKLRGYGSGIEKKRWLLEHERAHSNL